MIKQWLKYYKWRLLNPIIPCAICKLPSSLSICKHCSNELEINHTPYCKYCAKPNFTICPDCSNKPPVFSHTYCKYLYSMPLNKMLHQLKYKKDKTNTWALGYLLANVLFEVKTDTNFIIPMPISQQRQKERGFNQVDELLKYYQIYFKHLPIRDNIVQKIIDTPHQSNLSLHDRINLQQNAYHVNKKNDVQNKNILIVDDVLTSGNTANNLAIVLKNAGAKRVELCVLLRTAKLD
jgi:ComF family protein